MVASVLGRVMTIPDGMTDWTGITAPAVSDPSIVTAQKGISFMVTGGTEITVVLVDTLPPDEDRTEVVSGGQLIVVEEASGKGGRIIVQGG